MIKKMNRAQAYKFFSILFSYPEKGLFQEKNILELQREYVRLFITAKNVPCPPYESAYRDEQRRLMVFTQEIIKKYRKAGLRISKKFKDLPDHIAAELEFMYYLCYMEEKFKEENKEKARKFQKMQKEFLEEHLAKWVPKFCDDVIRESKLEFYKEAARLLKDFIERETTQ
ncbi:MAG: hypothetical protein DRN88_00940 [Candidatus Hydrothermarchaeota archaeon]|nr:MAG: hypothetical protein DRN88_00940 [Candidatus Hydrothermarchaeota archaeon]